MFAMPESERSALAGSGRAAAENAAAAREVAPWRRKEGEVLFEMLDRDKDGYLTRKEARSWLRSLGWCLTDAAFDALLEEAAGVSTEDSSHRRKWALAKLLEVADLAEDLCGPNPEALRAAFKTLGSQSSCTKDRLKQLATGHDGGLTEADIDELFALCGASSQRVSTDILVDGLVDCICQPKAHVHKAVLGQSRLFLPG
ncbi:Myl12b [Symbiodinium sp. CCMP2592]|nr:Myl12b [Symbiodinium sp. CCMP2592]